MSNLEKVTIRLNSGDFQRLRDLYPSIKANEAIRRLVRHHIRQVESALARDLPTIREAINQEPPE